MGIGSYILYRLWAFGWVLLLLLTLLAGVGVVMLYAVGGGDPTIWAYRHAIHFLVSLLGFIVVAFTDLRLIYRFTYVFFVFVLVLLFLVEFIGVQHTGSKRWLDFGFINFQPSELIKISVILVLARFFVDDTGGRKLNWTGLSVAFVMIGLPFVLIIRQPDLGTALVMLFSGLVIVFVAGISWKKIGLLSATLLLSLPVFWQYMLHPYQQQRILTFLGMYTDVTSDGYHITQSKIALGSGGMWGQGFLSGAHSNLNFLPERQTDFIFATFAEQFGFVGSIGLLVLYSLVVLYGVWVSIKSKDMFGKLIAIGASMSFGVYLLVNVGMVSGVLPVVGIPLPLVSRGGTSMLVMMLLMGLVMNVLIEHRLGIARQYGKIDR